MSNLKRNRVYLDPADPDDAMRQLAHVYDLEPETLATLRRIMTLYPRPILLYVDEANAPLYAQSPLADKFTFNIQTDELVLFSHDPLTFIDAMIEMAMYVAGFATLMGAEAQWMVEFAIGAWKPVRNRIKRRLGIPVHDEPRWTVGTPPPPEEAPLEDPFPFRTLVSQLDLASFTHMVRLAAREDVEVNFPHGTDPRVIEVYARVKTAMHQVADGLGLADWQEFNHRLLKTVQDLDDTYTPRELPVPLWWQRMEEDTDEEEEPVLAGLEGDEVPDGSLDPVGRLPGAPSDAAEDDWDPFADFIEHLFDDDSSFG